MKRTAYLKVLNPILAVVFLLQALSGLAHNKLTYQQFRIIHENGGKLLLLLVLAHVFVNWNWITANYIKSKKNHRKETNV